MSIERQVIAAELLQHYVHYLRTGEPLSAAEVEELRDLLDAAGGVGEALGGDTPESHRAAVSERLQAALAAGPPRSSDSPPARMRHPGAGMLLLPRFAAWTLLGALASCVAALFTVGWWHRPTPVVLRRPVPVNARDVEPLDEGQVHSLLPRMVYHGTISQRDERSLMWHMLVCPPCFDHYRRLKQEHGGTPAGADAGRRWGSDRTLAGR